MQEVDFDAERIELINKKSLESATEYEKLLNTFSRDTGDIIDNTFEKVRNIMNAAKWVGLDLDASTAFMIYKFAERVK